MAPTRSGVEPDTLLVHRALGTEARYRVLRADDELVEVEVLESPGLRRGAFLRLTAAAVSAMERLDGEPATAGVAVRARLLGGRTGRPART